jgi:predicted ATPase
VQPIARLLVGGLRGFSTEQTLEFAIPDGTNRGSGLTLLVGSNNAGKSAVIEALRFLPLAKPTSVSQGKRNHDFQDEVRIRVVDAKEVPIAGLRSLEPGGSETVFEPEAEPASLPIFVVPARRTFDTYFGDPGEPTLRDSYIRATRLPPMKQQSLSRFAGRLFKINSQPPSRAEFNRVLEQVISPVPDWTIDQADDGQYFVKFRWGSHTHSSDGLGEGLVSLLFIVDSLYDSEPGSVVVIDEPELSLHPQFQRRLQKLLSEYAKDRQIVCATHSPYFVSWPDFGRGARVARVFKGNDGSKIRNPQPATLQKLSKHSTNLNNPHLLGVEANEVFFLEDNVILVEGQEDVIFLPRIIEQLQVELEASFYGWGVGGAANMLDFAQLLQEMGYQRVVGILDNDQAKLRSALESMFPEFLFWCIAADDIRPKKKRLIRKKDGLLDDAGKIRTQHRQHTLDLLTKTRNYFSAEGHSAVTM